MVWWWVPYAIGIALSAVSYLLMPKPQRAPPMTAEKFSAPTPQPGEEIPVLFGTEDIEAANVPWWGNVRTEEIRSESGGKK